MFKIRKRNYSWDHSSSRRIKHRILEDPDNLITGLCTAYEHPPNSYKRYVSKYAQNDFKELRDMAKGDERSFKRLIRKVRPKRLLRINS